MHVPINATRNRRAVVMGSSMAGLAAARVLADFFSEVIVLDRDRLPDGPEVRQGTPQARQVHALLARGGLILEGLFPGLIPDLLAAGAVPIDTGTFHWYQKGFWRSRLQTGSITYSQTRPLLEWKVRSHLARHANVHIRPETPAAGLMWDKGRDRVTGVQLGSGEQLSADLVVDASGRGSRGPQWLEQAGFPAVPVSTLKVDIGYATRFYRIPPGERGWQSLVVNDGAAQKRVGGILPVEGDRWMVYLSGYGEQRPAADPEGFLDFARSLPVPAFYAALREAEPLGPVAPYRFPGYQRRHYERVARHPEGLVVLGDAACSFNPVYGQGMTTGLLGAMALGECLRSQAGQPAGLPQRFHRRLAPILDVPWRMAATEDYAVLKMNEGKPAGADLLLWYTERIHRLTSRDTDVMRRFLQVLHMTAPPSVLFSPSMVWRVATAGHRSTTGRGIDVATGPGGELPDSDQPCGRPAV